MYAEFLKFDPKAFQAFNGDFTKFYADFDPTKATEQFVEAFKGATVPSIDVNGVLEAQRKNIEALNKAGQVALDGAQQVAAKQAEIFKQGLDQATGAAETIGKADSPQALVVKQAELYKKAFETAIANSQKVTAVVTKTNDAATKVLSTRISESFDEIKGQIKSAK